MNVLDKIVRTKKAEIEALKADKPLVLIEKEAKEKKRSAQPFISLFETDTVLIAEVKPKSPSAGTLIEASPLEVAEIYAESDADAISVLTDKQYFGGSLDLLQRVSKIVPQPILRKDFIIDPYQVYETSLSNASAFLLIAAILSAGEMRELRVLGAALGLDTLTEVHNETELEKALESGAPLIGINNRNLQTLEIDLAVTERLSGKIPDSIAFISESGLATPDDVKRVRAAGARGILVGTSILRASDPLAFIASFKAALS